MLTGEELLNVLYLQHFRVKARDFSAPLLQMLFETISTSPCPRSKYEDACPDNSSIFILKVVAIASILAAGVIGISIPLAGKQRRFLNTDSNHFVAAKAFAAGVILATGFVHMLPDGTAALTDSCLPNSPWSKFPFSGFFAMVAALATLVVDFVGTQFYERKNDAARVDHGVGLLDSSLEAGGLSVEEGGKVWNEGVFGEEEGGGMHIVGIHAHAAHHRHSHPHGQEACEGQASANSHGHSHGFGDEHGVRHVVVSQILELGIISHSVIIGLSLGVSHSPCTVRPLIAALSFHQFFEGFALGGCVCEAQFATPTTATMACFFALTAPLGVCVGMGISSSYNAESARGLVIEGALDSASAGILVYMALVDLIAADFLSKRMSCNARLQVVSYLALFLGAMLMSSLAIWV